MSGLEAGNTAYIIENGFRVSECRIVSSDARTCVIRFPKGGGCRVRTSRLFPTKESAEAAISYKFGDSNQAIIEERERTPWG